MTNAFTGLGLSDPITEALTDLGFEEPTPIQAEAIPPLLAGRDVLGQAATGTGKTAAYALPLIERCICAGSGIPESASVMILTPTRELCLQVAESVSNYGKNLGIRVAPICGGQEYSRQIRLLKRGVHVVVATPGRAIDHMEKGTLDLSNIRTFVLDEADEMLDMGFAEELETLLDALPDERQTALFSATMPKRIEQIAKKHLKNPVLVSIAKEKSAEELPRVPQIAYMVPKSHRTAALSRVLEIENSTLAFVFARTRNEVDDITEAMRGRGFAVEALHGGLVQESRDRVIARAKAGAIEAVIATDVAARGLDLDNVTHVINYGLPASFETYVHRIGRTGRAGRTGKAISIIEPREHRYLRALEGITKAKIALENLPSLTDVHAKRMTLLKEAILEELGGDVPEKFQTLALQLCEAADPLKVAAAALSYIQKLSGNDEAEEDIPDVKVPQHRSLADRSVKKNRPHLSDRAPQQGMTRIYIGAGREAGITPADIVGAITHEANIPGRRVGAIDIADRFTLVEVDTPVAMPVINALRNTSLKGRSFTVKKDNPMKSSGYRKDADRAYGKKAKKAPSPSRFDDIE